MTLELQKLACWRFDRPLTPAVSLQVKRGEWCQFHGGNGVGKTTLLKKIAGLGFIPVEGNILWQGTLIQNIADYSRHLVYIGHELGIKSMLTPSENLWFYHKMRGEKIDAHEIQVRLDTWCLGKKKFHPISQLSQGQKRLCALSRLVPGLALIWLLDEPFNGLDGQASEILVHSMQQHLGMGGLIVLTSHIPVQCLGIGVNYHLEKVLAP
ncbi:MAG: heme ABC exporter ATP-binding protein CcmA [Gammaproteobacteria bacterium]|nr:heme ABC exporter ATP-binding protein CcmA [Gammaproteobacteria bacterium]